MNQLRHIVPLVFILCVVGCSYTLQAQISKRQELRTQIRLKERSASFSPRDTAYVDLLNNLAGEMRYYDADSLYVLAEKALKNSEDGAYRRGECISYLRLGDYFSDKGNTQKAMEYYKK